MVVFPLQFHKGNDSIRILMPGILLRGQWLEVNLEVYTLMEALVLCMLALVYEI
jgi:hypothetical protein